MTRPCGPGFGGCGGVSSAGVSFPGGGGCPPPGQGGGQVPVPIGSTGFGQFNEAPPSLFSVMLPTLPTYMPIFNSNFVLGDSTLFTQSDGRLKYGGTTARIFQVVAQLSGIVTTPSAPPPSTPPSTIFVAVFKNNSGPTHPYAFAVETIGGSFDVNEESPASIAESLSITDTVLLQPGDELSLWVSGTTTNPPGATLLVFSAQISAQ